MRWFTFFFLLLVESCTRFAFSINTKQFKDFGQLGIDADSGSSAFGADERENPSDDAGQSLNNHESGNYDNVSGERAGGIAAIKELLGFTHYKTGYQQLGGVEDDVDEQLSHLLKELSPQTFQRNSEEQLSTFPRPRDLFIDSQFTRADLKSGRIILWLKYFDAHGRKHDLSDNLKHRYEAYDLLMSVDGMNKKDLTNLLEKVKDDYDLKAFVDSMKDVVKQESQLDTLLQNAKNTPETVFGKLKVRVSQDDVNFFRWLRYCQLFKTKYVPIVQGYSFDGRIVGMLEKERSFDILMQLFTSIRESVGLATFADQLLATTRKQQIAKWLTENSLPKAIYAHLIKADIPLHKQLPDFVQWLEYVHWFDFKHVLHPKTDILEILAPGKDSASLFYLATIFINIKNERFVKDLSGDIFEIMEKRSVRLGELKYFAKVYRWFNPNNPRNKTYDKVIASYSRWLETSDLHVPS